MLKTNDEGDVQVEWATCKWSGPTEKGGVQGYKVMWSNFAGKTDHGYGRRRCNFRKGNETV